MRKTSRIWRAPARGLPRVRMARLLAVVLAGVTDVVLAVFMVVVLAVFSAVVLAVFSAVVMVMVWLVSKLLGVEARVEVVTGGETKKNIKETISSDLCLEGGGP